MVTELKKILIMEDEKPMARALELKLNHSGFLAISVNDGQAGLDLLAKENFSLILLDLMMPKMDGITMLKKLRVDSWGKDVPVVILSNLSDADKNIDVVDSSAQAYLIKSDWTLQDVVSKVKEILKIA